MLLPTGLAILGLHPELSPISTASPGKLRATGAWSMESLSLARRTGERCGETWRGVACRDVLFEVALELGVEFLR
jgi:hypothetical protein